MHQALMFRAYAFLKYLFLHLMNTLPMRTIFAVKGVESKTLRTIRKIQWIVGKLSRSF